MTALSAHLWQSLLCAALAALLALLLRSHSALPRLWLWRLAAGKFLAPFAALVALGEWLGFPVAHVADAPPHMLVTALRLGADWVQLPAGHGAPVWMGVALPPFTLLALAHCARRARQEARLHQAEQQRSADNPAATPPGMGLWRAALLSLLGLLLLAAPLLAGAVQDQQRRLAWLERNARQLRDARVTIRPAAPGQGRHYSLRVASDGVVIRNATLREIMALAFGVSPFAVQGVHFRSAGEGDWLLDERHDVQIAGPVSEPERFESYALREPLTRAMATQYGIEVYLDGRCLPPCGRWGQLQLPPAAAALPPN